jgi:uncharacterized protein YgbK (DUF1537 family)
VTAGQIAWATANGFAEIALDAAATEGWERQVETALGYLNEGRSLVLHTGHTPVGSMPAASLGTALGKLVSSIVGGTRKVRRLVIAGGDTSSYAARALGIEAVEMVCPLNPGAPLCRVHAPGSPVDGLEINLKGGQVGAADYFGKLLAGKK